MNLLINSHPTKRGGNNGSRPNTRQEARGNALATQWAGRNLRTQSPAELERTRQTLLDCGVSADTTMYSRPARLLKQINEVLNLA